jgi:hypothetical protein
MSNHLLVFDLENPPRPLPYATLPRAAPCIADLFGGVLEVRVHGAK